MTTLKQIQEQKYKKILTERDIPFLTMDEHRKCTKEWLQQNRVEPVCNGKKCPICQSLIGSNEFLDELLEELEQ